MPNPNQTQHAPRTDRVAAEPIGFYSCATVPADFARTLERENAELREALQSILDSEDTTLGDGGSILGDDLRTIARAALAKAPRQAEKPAPIEILRRLYSFPGVASCLDVGTIREIRALLNLGQGDK